MERGRGKAYSIIVPGRFNLDPGDVKTEFALGKGRTVEGVAGSGMLEPEDVAAAVLLACTQSPKARIIELQMRTMDESLT